MAFGQTINPGYMNVDYSPIVGAAQAREERHSANIEGAKNIAAAVIGGFTGMPIQPGTVADMFQQKQATQKQWEQETNTAASIASLLAKKAPGLVPGAEETAMILQDKDVPLSERYQRGASFMNSMGMGFKIEEQLRERELFELQKQKMQQAMMNQGSQKPQAPSFFGTPPQTTPAQQGFTYPQ